METRDAQNRLEPTGKVLSSEGPRSPLVSYIVPFFNGSAHLAETLGSILAQTYSEIEVVVVDDGSDEPCAPITDPLGPRVRVIRTVNHGVSGARNVGLAAARGDFVTFLDQDDLVYPPHAELLGGAMRSDPEVDGAFCSVVILRDGLAPKEQAFCRYDSPLELFKTRMTLSMGALMFRRSALVGLGGFDLTFNNVGEDWDFCLRFARFRRLEYVAEPLFGFRRHRSQASWGADRMAQGALSVLQKHRLCDGPGALTSLEARRARAGIMGYWAQWYRASLKSAGLWSRRTPALLGHLLTHPGLLRYIVAPPLKRIAMGGRRRTD